MTATPTVCTLRNGDPALNAHIGMSWSIIWSTESGTRRSLAPRRAKDKRKSLAHLKAVLKVGPPQRPSAVRCTKIGLRSKKKKKLASNLKHRRTRPGRSGNPHAQPSLEQNSTSPPHPPSPHDPHPHTTGTARQPLRPPDQARGK